MSRARVVMKGDVVITFPPSSTFQNAEGNIAAPCSGAVELLVIPFSPFSPLVEVHQSLHSMVVEVSSNRNYSVRFFALLKWAEKLLQPQNIRSGWGLWSWNSCPPLLAGGCRASRPHQWGKDPAHLWRMVWKGSGGNTWGCSLLGVSGVSSCVLW